MPIDPVAGAGAVSAMVMSGVALVTVRNNRKAAQDTTVLGAGKLELEKRQAEDAEMKELWTELRALRSDLVGEREARRELERELNNERQWSMFLEDFLREHDMPIPPRPIRVRPESF